MSDVLETKAGYAGALYPWPREVKADPVCAAHDPELWFPHDKADYTEAVRLCLTCPLLVQCGEIALARGESGVWGGMLLKGGRVLSGFPQQGRPKKQ